jgi:hypothetical protein
MKELKKILRVLVLTLLILLALSGIGIIGAFFSNNRERYRDKEITFEMVDKDRNENETQLGDEIQVKG